jgi:hypothetical protein
MFVSQMKVIAATSAALLTACVAAGALAQQASKNGPAKAGAPGGPPLAAALAPKAPPAETRELARDDGKAAGKKSIAGSGHAVRFEAPGDDWTLTAVALHGSRYGYPKAPDEDFHVYLCDEKFQKLADFPFPYAKYQRGESKWVELPVKPTKVPKTFLIGFGFNPAQTKGVYVSHDAEGSGHSLVGLPGDEMKPFDKGDWLIRAKIVQAP